MTTTTETRPECPHGHGRMVPRPLQGQTREQIWCGTWYDCPPGPVGEHCSSSVLVPSAELAAEQARSNPRYADGQVIEYMSFDPSGYTVGQVVRYAGEPEQDNPADRLVYVRSRVGGKSFPVRESQLRVRGGAHKG